jgi:catechol 2,3-dioxygenase-like lactoylglutathione lyase family enzyme
MLPISGLYEVAVRVKSLPRAETFYREVLGLRVAIRDPKRPIVFLRVGADAGMLVLQEDPGEFPKLHFAFTIAATEIERAATVLRERGLAVRGPVLHEWMAARSVYFSDPDGHDLELCAPATSS